MDFPGRLAYDAASATAPTGGSPGEPVKKAKPLPHRNRGKSSRYRAKLKAKHRRVRTRRSSGHRRTYR
jgi:hypothetical protein